jgi:NAD(P)H-dependent flavin oxidoreductase YrpB (nitropropane dioxygenase family)
MARQRTWVDSAAYAGDVLKTRACTLLGIEHPVVLAGMGSATNPQLVAAVSNAGGLGILGCALHPPGNVLSVTEAIRDLTQL